MRVYIEDISDNKGVKKILRFFFINYDCVVAIIVESRNINTVSIA